MSGGSFFRGFGGVLDVRLARRHAETDAARAALRQLSPVADNLRAYCRTDVSALYKEYQRWWPDIHRELRDFTNHWHADWQFAIRSRRVHAGMTAFAYDHLQTDVAHDRGDTPRDFLLHAEGLVKSLTYLGGQLAKRVGARRHFGAVY